MRYRGPDQGASVCKKNASAHDGGSAQARPAGTASSEPPRLAHFNAAAFALRANSLLTYTLHEGGIVIAVPALRAAGNQRAWLCDQSRAGANCPAQTALQHVALNPVPARTGGI